MASEAAFAGATRGMLARDRAAVAGRPPAPRDERDGMHVAHLIVVLRG